MADYKWPWMHKAWMGICLTGYALQKWYIFRIILVVVIKVRLIILCMCLYIVWSCRCAIITGARVGGETCWYHVPCRGGGGSKGEITYHSMGILIPCAIYGCSQRLVRRPYNSMVTADLLLQNIFFNLTFSCILGKHIANIETNSTEVVRV